jgi:hypothetical protein
VVYSNFEGVGQKEVPRPGTKVAPPVEDDEDDDLDIDDI